MDDPHARAVHADAVITASDATATRTRKPMGNLPITRLTSMNVSMSGFEQFGEPSRIFDVKTRADQLRRESENSRAVTSAIRDADDRRQTHRRRPRVAPSAWPR